MIDNIERRQLIANFNSMYFYLSVGYLRSFAKYLTREYWERTTPSRIFMPCNLSSCRVALLWDTSILSSLWLKADKKTHAKLPHTAWHYIALHNSKVKCGLFISLYQANWWACYRLPLHVCGHWKKENVDSLVTSFVTSWYRPRNCM